MDYQNHIIMSINNTIQSRVNGLTNDLDLWKLMLRAGQDVQATTDTLARAWWQNSAVMAYKNQLSHSNSSSRSRYWPWNRGTYLDLTWLERAKNLISQSDGERFPSAILGVIKSGDRGLAKLVHHSPGFSVA